MDRRSFFHSGLQASAGLALMSSLQQSPALAALFDGPAKRVGLIGTGWYGKCDLFRLIQVAPVEVVSLCDVDSEMVANAATMVSERQKSKNKPRIYSDYRKMLAEKDLDVEEIQLLGGTRPKFAYPPQLIVVDGGSPQVAAAAAALSDAGVTDIALVGLAKRLEEVWLPGSNDPVIFPRHSEGLYLLQRIRDEAHRFAQHYHHLLRRKRTLGDKP